MPWQCPQCKGGNYTLIFPDRGICSACKIPLERADAESQLKNLNKWTMDPDIIILKKEEAKALIKELETAFISRDNPLCSEVLTKLLNFVKN